MNKGPRNEQRIREGNVRIQDFEEVSLGFDYDTMKSEAARCLNCKHAPCVAGCPVGVRIPEFIQCLNNDDLDGAVKTIKLTNNLPAICGRVCPQERQCEARCVRQKAGGSVAIGGLERFVGDYALEHGEEKAVIENKLDYKVAVVGSGPAGLTCAVDCAMAGLDVTVYEALHRAGGVLTYGIPEFRLPKDKVVNKEISKLIEAGVKIKTNMVVGKTILVKELTQDFDAVFLGTGAGLPMFMNIPGEGLNGVYSANEFLTRANLMKAYVKDSDTPIFCGNKVAIVGAGNVAMDAARTAKRLGAEHVYIIYRRSREEMPAREEEIEHAVEEGIELMLLTNPTEILGESTVTAIKCVKMELGEADATGRRSPIEIANSEFVLEVDEVIMSLGTRPNPMIIKDAKELEVSKRGTLVINQESQETNIHNVFAGGDAVTGAATVILAMGAGKLAAKTIIDRARAK